MNLRLARALLITGEVRVPAAGCEDSTVAFKMKGDELVPG